MRRWRRRLGWWIMGVKPGRSNVREFEHAVPLGFVLIPDGDVHATNAACRQSV